jgi:hypothetical protein
MQKTRPGQGTPAADPRDLAAQRFPLVPRTRPACRALDVRAARVRDLARLADQRTSESLVRAAEAHNLAALITSDCGLPAVARKLCWQQSRIFLAFGSFNSATAKLALQPLVNLGRLLLRDGDGTAAYRLLDELFAAVRSRADTVIDGSEISFAGLISDAGDHREVVRWLWSVLLADGTRALTRAGRWPEALQHAEQHKGIGQRLLDGRQVAVLAHCAAGDHEKAQSLLAATSTPTPWEEAVAACMKVLCLTWAGQPASTAIATMTDRYLSLEPAREHAVFRVRLGLSVLDLAGGGADGAHRVQQVAEAVTRDALGAADAYAAHDALSHATCLSHMTARRSPALTGLVRAAGLGLGTMPAEVLGNLMESVTDSEASIMKALNEQTRAQQGT